MWICWGEFSNFCVSLCGWKAAASLWRITHRTGVEGLWFPCVLLVLFWVWKRKSWYDCLSMVGKFQLSIRLIAMIAFSTQKNSLMCWYLGFCKMWVEMIISHAAIIFYEWEYCTVVNWRNFQSGCHIFIERIFMRLVTILWLFILFSSLVAEFLLGHCCWRKLCWFAPSAWYNVSCS